MSNKIIFTGSAIFTIQLLLFCGHTIGQINFNNFNSNNRNNFNPNFNNNNRNNFNPNFNNNFNTNNQNNFNVNNNNQNQNDLNRRYFDLFASSPYVTAPASPGAPTGFERYNLSSISASCPKNSFYASYNPSHNNAVGSLTQFYNDQPDLDSMIRLSEYFKQSPDIHPKVWYTSFIRAQVFRTPNSLELDRPNPIELFPSSFFVDRLLNQSTSSTECVLLDERFGADNGVENALWYFREDVQLNAHHWIWHLLYPVNSTEGIDRRGEFFYFFHHEMMARYASERLSNGLPPVVVLNMEQDTVIEEGYRAHLTDGISTLPWADRQPFRRLSEALNSTLRQELVNLTITRDRVLSGIQDGAVLHDGQFFRINDYDHIDTLGELVEASNHSINPRHYGTDGYHNAAHWIIANIDTHVRQGIEGVMGDTSTAMRDIVFYRWHEYVDRVFQSYKERHLQPYFPLGGELPLVYPGVQLTSLNVIPEAYQGGTTNNNVLQTYWSMRRFNLAGGLDFNAANASRPDQVNICAKHLDHQEFYYQLRIENTHHATVLGTIRIFMAPRYKNQQQTARYTMAEQRTLFFALDSFQTVLRPGNNLVNRRSIDSTLTIDWPKSLEELRQELNTGVKGRTVCDCGYPHHLLLPKGTESGLTFDLFAMVSNGVEDQVKEEYTQEQQRNYGRDTDKCTPAHIHCGVHGKKYPDGKPMGYPFDRRPYVKPMVTRTPAGQQTQELNEVRDLEDYIADVPNMRTTQIVVQHKNEFFGLQNYRVVQ